DGIRDFHLTGVQTCALPISSRLINGQAPMIFEDGRQKRDFVHVRDVARAFRLALEQKPAAGHVINIGSGHAYSIVDVATMLAARSEERRVGKEGSSRR